MHSPYHSYISYLFLQIKEIVGNDDLCPLLRVNKTLVLRSIFLNKQLKISSWDILWAYKPRAYLAKETD